MVRRHHWGWVGLVMKAAKRMLEPMWNTRRRTALGQPPADTNPLVAADGAMAVNVRVEHSAQAVSDHVFRDEHVDKHLPLCTARYNQQSQA